MVPIHPDRLAALIEVARVAAALLKGDESGDVLPADYVARFSPVHQLEEALAWLAETEQFACPGGAQ